VNDGHSVTSAIICITYVPTVRPKFEFMMLGTAGWTPDHIQFQNRYRCCVSASPKSNRSTRPYQVFLVLVAELSSTLVNAKSTCCQRQFVAVGVWSINHACSGIRPGPLVCGNRGPRGGLLHTAAVNKVSEEIQTKSIGFLLAVSNPVDCLSIDTLRPAWSLKDTVLRVSGHAKNRHAVTR
jgi:hypothetical protein